MFLSLIFSALLAQSLPASPAAAPAVYVPERVYDTRRSVFTDFEVMLADLSAADVVFIGEQHDDPNTHRLEQAILDGLRRRRVAVTVSLEMFERDVQHLVDHYLAGSITEAQFLQDARPWPRYTTDYRPLVELAKTEGWGVVAANVPRRVAAEVAKSGKAALDRLSREDTLLVARDVQCPEDAYFERFVEAMTGHARSRDKPDGADHAMNDRYYWSQCIKDETMAESIAGAVEHRKGTGGTVVHFTGAFHSDFGTGTTERARRRLSGRRVAVVSLLPVVDIDALSPAGDDLRRADYLVYTVK
jgi:uncharacterized iron-regulated protein